MFLSDDYEGALTSFALWAQAPAWQATHGEAAVLALAPDIGAPSAYGTVM